MNKEAILRAADWLEANPARHIAFSMARTIDEKKVSPSSPKAFSFCALGRIAKETGRDLPEDFGLHSVCAVSGLSFDQVRLIYFNNDGSGDRRKGDPKVIHLLRKLAA